MHLTWHVEQAIKDIRRGLETSKKTDLITTFQPKTMERADEPPVILCLISHKILKKYEVLTYRRRLKNRFRTKVLNDKKHSLPCKNKIRTG
jgi:hypothetical protein